MQCKANYQKSFLLLPSLVDEDSYWVRGGSPKAAGLDGGAAGVRRRTLNAKLYYALPSKKVSSLPEFLIQDRIWVCITAVTYGKTLQFGS
jgi:hypothetical protein